MSAAPKQSKAKRVVTLTLPWPPTANTYWRRNGHRYFIAPAGIEFRQDVWNVAMTMRSCYDRAPLTGPVAVSVRGNPPDNRRRDLDNILKALLDSLKYAGVYKDDSQVKRLEAEMFEPVEGGRVIVTVEER